MFGAACPMFHYDSDSYQILRRRKMMRDARLGHGSQAMRKPPEGGC